MFRPALTTVVLLFATSAYGADGERAAAKTERERPSLVTALPRVGLVAWGVGSKHLQCDGNCLGFRGPNDGYEHRPAFTLGADVLFGIGQYVRVGPSFTYTFVNDVALGGRTFGVGDDFTVNAAVEGFFPFAERWGIAPRLEGGLLDLMPGGDLRDYVEGIRQEFCPIVNEACSIPGGARLGWNLGVGAGAWVRAHEVVRVRLDVLFQYYALTLYTVNGRLFGNPIEAYDTLSGVRLFLTAGVELF